MIICLRTRLFLKHWFVAGVEHVVSKNLVFHQLSVEGGGAVGKVMTPNLKSFIWFGGGVLGYLKFGAHPKSEVFND